MSNIILNRLRFTIFQDEVEICFNPKEELFFKKTAKLLLNILEPHKFYEIKNKLIEAAPKKNAQENYSISFDFPMGEALSGYPIALNLNSVPYFKKFYIKRYLINFFGTNGYIVEPFPTGVDISVYEQVSEFNNDWGVYRRYDIVIFSKEQELSVSIGSHDTLISNISQTVSHLEHVKAVDVDGYIKREKFLKGKDVRLVANAKIRRSLGVKNKILRTFYYDSYKLLNKFYEFLLNRLNGSLRVESGGFKTVHPADIGQVDFEKNLMLFGKEHTDVNAASGMRDGGPFEVPTSADKIKFLFIYENKEQANQLFLNLKKGLKHFPGLLSYVGIPVNLANERLQYSSRLKLKGEFDEFLNNTLIQENYSDYFAIVLLPFSRETATEEDSNTYYYIKEQLLKKGIASQDLEGSRISSGSFHYHLPNIAIAVLAKIGGVPWKLKRKVNNELVVGFNEEKVGENAVIGTAVYFDNSGKLKQIKSFQEDDRSQLIHSLKASITEYLLTNELPPKRLIIHYYKPPKREDMKSIQSLIRDEFRFNLPFALVEINDSKVNAEMCFDVDYNYGMPASGLFVRLSNSGNEYLLFNNLRYWKNPIKAVNVDEYPIKIKLYNTETGGFTHEELISQVYEFSRLYWKGLKQKSQPVTTQYSKMVAVFASHFENNLMPHNAVSQKTAWFI